MSRICGAAGERADLGSDYSEASTLVSGMRGLD
jgi:hypothetical protein